MTPEPEPENKPASPALPQREVFFWVAGAVLFFFILWLLKGVLLPFVAALAVAYILDPFADWLEKLGLSRLAATSVITVFFSVIGVIAAILLLPLLYDQAIAFLESVPLYVDAIRSWIETLKVGRLAQLLGGNNGALGKAAGDAASGALNWGLHMLGSLWSGGIAFVNLLSLLIVTPIVAFYLLLDWDRMVERADQLLPRQHARTLRGLAREMDGVLAGFVRGQGTVCLVLGIFYAVSLSLAGLQFGLVVGLMAGLVSFIPYLGSISGFLVAGLLALFQFWPDPVSIAVVLGIFILGQFIEGNFLSPRLLGSRVRLHPVWVMFALFAFGYLLGFVGMLLAVPVAAAIGVLVRFATRRYQESPLYLGHDDRPAP